MYSVFHNAIRPRNKFHPRQVYSLMIRNQKGAKNDRLICQQSR